MADSELGIVSLKNDVAASIVRLANLELELSDALPPSHTVRIVGFVAPFGYCVLEALRLRLSRRGILIELEESIGNGYRRPFSQIIGYGGAGVGSKTTIMLESFDSRGSAKSAHSWRINGRRGLAR